MNEIFVYGSIVDDEDATSDDVTCPKKFRRALASIGDSKNLTVHINSAGGSVPAGVAMANMISARKGNTTAIVDGICCSIATQIFFSADQCLMPENTFLYIHKPTTSTSGNEDEMTSAAKTLSAIQKGLETVYRRKAKVPPEKITEMMNAETWLTAEQAAQVFDITVLSPTKMINAVDMSPLKNIPDQVKQFDKESQERKKQKLKEMLDEIDRYCAPWTKNERTDEKMKNINQNISMPDVENERRLYNRAFNKLLLNPLRAAGIPLTDEERTAFENVSGSPGAPGQISSVPSRGGMLLSEEQFQTIIEYRQKFVELKNFCNVIPTSASYGRFPTLPIQSVRFTPFEQLSDIAEDNLAFDELTFTIEDRGIIVPISLQVLEDADIDVISIVGRTLARAAVTSENEEILGVLNSLITNAPVATGVADLNTALYKTLDGIYEPSSVLYCNQDSFIWLASLEDSNHRPLLDPDLAAPGSYRYRGHQIVVIPNNQFPSWTSNAATYCPILIGDMQSAVVFFERAGLELATSREYLFRKYGAAVRAVIRFDVVRADTNAMTALQIRLP